MSQSDLPLTTDASGKSWLEKLVEHPLFRHGITTVILINALILGAQTYAVLPDMVERALARADQIVVYIFVAELVLKLFAWRLRFFRSGWNWFDLGVVSISLVPAAEAFTVLRALRVLRLFRLFSVMPQMRAVVEALGRAIPRMGAILMVLGLIFYVAAVMASKLFSGTHPEFFGDLGRSAFTLFQIMTLESWSMGVARPVIAVHPYAWLFFVPFIILTTFAVLNLFIAVMVDSLQSKYHDVEEAREEAAQDARDLMFEEVARLRREIASLREALIGDHRDGSSDMASKREDSAE